MSKRSLVAIILIPIYSYIQGLIDAEMDKIELATKKCVMVRYPLMKIKEIKNISHVPCSALCIIPKNTLSELLIKIEIPVSVRRRVFCVASKGLLYKKTGLN